jgi:hypothetical protein
VKSKSPLPPFFKGGVTVLAPSFAEGGFAAPAPPFAKGGSGGISQALARSRHLLLALTLGLLCNVTSAASPSYDKVKHDYVSTEGVGHFTKLFAETFDPAPLFALIGTLAAIAIGLNELVRIAERRFRRLGALARLTQPGELIGEPRRIASAALAAHPLRGPGQGLRRAAGPL